jgi:AcrR family transcriptional regulator
MKKTKRPRRSRVEKRPTLKDGILSQKAQLTRDNIKRAALELLNDHGFRNLHITDVTQRAGVANGLFYRYFRDLRGVTQELCEDLFNQINKEASAVPFSLHPFDWIYEMHLIAGTHFATNPGLLACMFELPGEFGEFGEVWKELAHTWNLRVAKFLNVIAGLPPAAANQLAFVLGAMAEGIYYQALIRHTQDLTKIGRSPEAISQIISIAWYRTIFCEDPSSRLMRSSVRLAGAGSSKTRG